MPCLLRIYLFTILTILVFSFSSSAQTSNIILPPFEAKPLAQLFSELEQEHGLEIYYKPSWINKLSVSNNEDTYLDRYLAKTLGKQGFQIAIRGRQIILYIEEDFYFLDPEKVPPGSILIGHNKPLAPIDKEVQWHGKVIDPKNSNSLAGVYIRNAKHMVLATSNSDGNFILSLLPGLYQLTFSQVGYEPTQATVVIRNSGKQDIFMYDSSTMLEEVTVVDQASGDNITSNRSSKVQMDIATIEKIPAFFGEVDVIKSLLSMPGVSTVGEGAAGINVRGGNTDQNLILFEGAPMYSSSHLFGFFSNLNPEIIESISLYKGAIPAKYGNRVSSVLDIQSTRLKHKNFKLRGGIGLISSRIATEVPIIEGKSSVLLSGRMAYPDWIIKKVNDLSIKKSSARFYDINGKWEYLIGKKDMLSISAYQSEDNFRLAADTLYGWTTRNLSSEWQHAYNPNFTSTLFLAYSDYYTKVEGEKYPYEFSLRSGLSDKLGKLEIYYLINNNSEITAGLQLKQYHFQPGNFTKTNISSKVAPVEIAQENAVEYAGFAEYSYQVNPVAKITGGLRYSSYALKGPGQVRLYSTEGLRNNENIIDTTQFSEGKDIVRYAGLEPRLSATYQLNALSSVKSGYHRMRQYLQVISNTMAVTPTDIWKSSDTYIKPLIGDQFSVGYYRNSKNNVYEFSAEMYYKALTNIIEYKDGARLLLNETLEQDLVAGKGRAYGLEIMVKKAAERLSGWISYTLSRSEVKVKGNYLEETINNGNYYPAYFDQPHNLSVVANYSLTKRLSFGANFVYITGRPVTAPVAKYLYNGIRLAAYSERNQYRIPDYHRLDLSLTLKGGHKKKKILNGDWVFSLYNFYARKNAYSVFFKHEPGSPPQAYKLAVLGTVFPSLSYNFNL